MGVYKVLRTGALAGRRAYLGAPWGLCGYGAGAATGVAMAVSWAPWAPGEFLSDKPLLGASVPGDGISVILALFPVYSCCYSCGIATS